MYQSGQTTVHHSGQLIFDQNLALDSVDLGPSVIDSAEAGQCVWLGSSEFQTILTLSPQPNNLTINSLSTIQPSAKQFKFDSVQLDSDPPTVYYSPDHPNIQSATSIRSTNNKTPNSTNSQPSRIQIRGNLLVGSQGGLDRFSYAVGDGFGLVGLVRGSASSAVASVGRVLGNRKTLIKYLNNNLVGLVSHSYRHNTTAQISLVDGHSGQLVQTILLEHIIPSTINLVIHHHKLVISATNSNKLDQSTTIYSIELYKHSNELVALSRSFVSPEGLRVAAATETNLQITTTNFLCKPGLRLTAQQPGSDG